MGVPARQQLKIAQYILTRKLKGESRYPLVLMLEPLFRCNLSCAGCGKIDYPDEILNRRLSEAECIQAVEECGAPVVSIAGGEPLLHKEMPQIVKALIERRKFVYLCTNALLLKKRLDDYQPSPYLTFSVHLDGNRDHHDASVCQTGIFDKVVPTIRDTLARGFRVTVNCTLFQNETPAEIADFFDFVTDLGVEGITVSPGFSYEHAPRNDVFLQRQETKQLFRDVFKLRRRKKWPLNHSALYLDFLAGNQNYKCTPWGNPTRNVLGWQRPCYLLVDEGYAASFSDLMDNTQWNRYGSEHNPKCANCMAHCGFEPTAVNDALAHPLKALGTSLRGPRVSGAMVSETPLYSQKIADASSQPVINLAVESVTRPNPSNRNH